MQIEILFHRAKSRVIDRINKIIALEEGSTEKVGRLLAIVNELIRTRIIFSQDEPAWNISAHISESILRVEGMALLVEIDPSYLLGSMYHEFGHRINAASSIHTVM